MIQQSVDPKMVNNKMTTMAMIMIVIASAFPTISCFSFGPSQKQQALFGVAMRRSVRTAISINNNNVKTTPSSLTMVAAGDDEATGTFFQKVEDSDSTAVPYVDPSATSSSGPSFIECYVDSVATVNHVEYSIGSPCDYAVALCYFGDDGELNPVDLDDDALMDEVFPIAASIVEEEFGEELALMRTPQTLTLVGELELGGDDMEEYEFDEDDMEDEEEEVEILLTFEHDDKEFNLVRLLDPVLLVGKQDPENPQARVLLDPEESDKVMPYLEEMILDYHEENE